MDVLIKNMEMPKEPTYIIIYPEGKWQETTSSAEGKAIELPPHGRLIDESVIMDNIQALLKERSWMYASHAQEIIDIIRNAPTVVEASK